MREESEIKYCKNKKCHKPLPAGYKHKYCEACRNNQAEKMKNTLKGVGAGLGTAACIAVTIVTAGKVNPKK